MRYAIISGGIVANIIESDADFAAAIGAIPAGDAGIGYAFDGEVFTPLAAVVPVPESVSQAQARLAMLNAGLLDAATAAVTAAGPAAVIEWEWRQTIRRDSPLVAGAALSLGLTDGQVDALFIAAAAL